VRAPLRAIFAEACDARHRERRPICPNPSIPGLRFSSSELVNGFIGAIEFFSFRFVGFGAQDARCSSPLLHCGGSGRNARSGGAMDRADSAACTRMCTQRNTGRGRVLFGQEPEKRNAKGVFSLVTFSCTSKRK